MRHAYTQPIRFSAITTRGKPIVLVAKCELCALTASRLVEEEALAYANLVAVEALAHEGCTHVASISSLRRTGKRT